MKYWVARYGAHTYNPSTGIWKQVKSWCLCATQHTPPNERPGLDFQVSDLK